MMHRYALTFALALLLPQSFAQRSPAITCAASEYVKGDGTCGSPGGGLSAGSIILVASGSCPATFSEVAALDGKFLLGTMAVHGDVGGTGGADNITPAGTVAAPTFTGNSVSSSLVGAGTPAGTVAWPAGVPTYTGALGTLAVTAHTVVATKQGTAAGNVVTTATHAFTGVPGGTVAWPAGVPTFAGSALGTHQHTTTATGSNSAPAFTGTSFDNRPAYLKVIFCSKD